MGERKRCVLGSLPVSHFGDLHLLFRTAVTPASHSKAFTGVFFCNWATGLRSNRASGPRLRLPGGGVISDLVPSSPQSVSSACPPGCGYLRAWRGLFGEGPGSRSHTLAVMLQSFLLGTPLSLSQWVPGLGLAQVQILGPGLRSGFSLGQFPSASQTS